MTPKRKAHEAFDRLWKTRLVSRDTAYKLLAEMFYKKYGHRRFKHISKLNKEQCNVVIKWSDKKLAELLKRGHDVRQDP